MPLKYNRKRWDDALSRVDPTRFETLLADHYRGEGWSVDHVGAAAIGCDTDGGIDLKLRRGEEYVVVQCKRWTVNQVPHNDVHQLIGVMVTQRATGAVLVTSGEFSRAAIDAASRLPMMQLVDGETVRRWIDLDALEAEATTKAADGPGVSDEWAHAASSRASAHTSRARPRRDKGALIPAIAAIAALAVFLAFVFLPPRLRRPTTAESTRVAAAPVAYAPPRAPVNADATPRAPARAGYLTGVAQPVNRAVNEYLRQTAAVPDVYRPIDHEAARMAAKSVAGVRSAFWLDHDNVVVMVDGAQYRSMAMIDQVCVALEPLGDTLAVVVNVQDVTAQHADGATTLSRNCQLPEGQRAFLQRKRQVDVLAPEVRARFKDQQAKK
jgi:hypothetical protein